MIVLLPVVARIQTELFAHTRKQHLEHAEFDIGSLALPIAFSFIWLYYYSWPCDFATSEIVEEWEPKEIGATQLIAMGIAAVVMLLCIPILLTLIYGSSTDVENFEEIEDIDEQPCAHQSSDTDSLPSSKDCNSCVHKWWLASSWEIWSGLFRHTLAFLTGLAILQFFQALCKKYLINAAGIAMLLFVMSLILCPMFFAYFGWWNLARKEISRTESHDISDKPKSPIATTANPLSVGPAGLDEALITGKDNHMDDSHAGGESIVERSFSCMASLVQCRRRMNRHSGSVAMIMCRLIVGWSLELVVIQSLKATGIHKTDKNGFLAVAVIFTSLVFLMSARAHAYFDQTSRRRSELLSAVRHYFAEEYQAKRMKKFSPN